MLFDLSMTELMLIGVVALVVIGPKDLPKALRVAGYWIGKARTLSREFHSSFEQMIREAELHEMRQELKKATEIDLDKEFRQTIDPTGSLAESLKPPELPKLFDADPPPAPKSATHPDHAAQVTEPEPVAPLEGAAPPIGARPVAPAEAGAQDSHESSAGSGFPHTRE